MERRLDGLLGSPTQKSLLGHRRLVLSSEGREAHWADPAESSLLKT